MRRFVRVAMIGFALLSGGTAMAQTHQAKILYARNNCWPQPFRAADAQSVIAPFEIMRNNGWRENNTLGSLLFNNENALSEAGSLKIQWILSLAPPSQRIIYVKSGQTQEITSARVESVQLAISQMVPTGPLPQILLTDIDPPTSSGAYQTLLHQALIRTTPTPRLQTFSGLNTPSQQTVAPNAQQGGTSTSSAGGAQ